MAMHIAYTVSLAIQTTALAHSCHGNLQMHLTPTKLLRPRHIPTHTHTWFLFTLAQKHKHTDTSTEFPLYLFNFVPNTIFRLRLSLFSFHLPACLCICPYVLLDDSLSLRRHAHRPPTVRSLSVWCTQHTKLERTFSIWQSLIWLADSIQHPGVKTYRVF